MSNGPNRIFQQVGGGFAQVDSLYVSGTQLGPGVAALFVSGDPNGTVNGVKGQLAVDRATGDVWQNTTNGTAWAAFTGGGGGGGVLQSLGFSPMAPDPYPGANMPEGQIDNYADPSLATHSLLWFKGADNQGTRLTGMDSTGVAPGSVRAFVNLALLGVGQCDAGTVTLIDENDPLALNSLAVNRFKLGGCTSHTCPILGMTLMVYGPSADIAPADRRWVLLSDNGMEQRTVTQSLQFYPNLHAGTVEVPLTGNLDDWDPIGWSPYLPGEGIGGSNCEFRSHSLIRAFVAADDGATPGATITGMVTRPGGLPRPPDFGPVKVIVNYGPGTLRIAHLSGLSVVENRIYCPNARDLLVPMYSAVWLYSPYDNLPDNVNQWRVLGMGNEVFPTVETTVARVEALQLAGQVSGVLPALPTVVSDWDPFIGNPSHSVIEALTNVNGSAIDGLNAPASATFNGNWYLLKNTGDGPLVILPEVGSLSDPENQFVLPGSAPLVLSPKSGVAIRYDSASKWRAYDNGNTQPTARLTSRCTPAILPAAAVNDYAPVDELTALPGRYAQWWRVRGSVGTVLTGIDATPAGCVPFLPGDRIAITNLSSAFVIAHFSVLSAAGNKIWMPDAVDGIIRNFGTVEFTYDDNNVWVMTAGTRPDPA